MDHLKEKINEMEGKTNEEDNNSSTQENNDSEENQERPNHVIYSKFAQYGQSTKPFEKLFDGKIGKLAKELARRSC